jgi:hypothetical protein
VASLGVWDETRERVKFERQLDLSSTRIIQSRETDVGFVMVVTHGEDVELHSMRLAGVPEPRHWFQRHQ